MSRPYLIGTDLRHRGFVAPIAPPLALTRVGAVGFEGREPELETLQGTL